MEPTPKTEKIILYKPKVLKSIVSLLLFLVLLSISILLWYIIKEKAYGQVSKTTSANAEYYANEIELKHNKIGSSLKEIADNSTDFEEAGTKWDEQANFYIQNSEGIESIIFVDKDFIIKRVASSSENSFSSNLSFKEISLEKDQEFLVAPIYKASELKGFVVGEIDILRLVFSVFEENQNDYEIKIFAEGVPIYTAENWELSKNDFSKRMQFDLKNSVFYELEIKPSDELIYLNTRHANQTLLFGCILSIGIAFVIWIALKLNYKSKLLLQAQNKLISNQAELEYKNSTLQKQLRNQQKLESIGLLASGVAHEINNPINGILNYSQLIMDSSDINSDNIVYTKEIIFETERISNLVSNLLQFSRQGKESFSHARIEDIIQRSATLVKTILKKDQIDLKLNIPEFLPDLKCRSQEIQQVLMNLIINARDSLNDKFKKYDEDKQIILTAEKVYLGNKNWVRVTVQDYGKGIPLSVQSKIFEQFFTTKAVGKGTGLGLAISYEIVKEHSGKLSFESKEGEYTKFYLDLPLD